MPQMDLITYLPQNIITIGILFIIWTSTNLTLIPNINFLLNLTNKSYGTPLPLNLSWNSTN